MFLATFGVEGCVVVCMSLSKTKIRETRFKFVYENLVGEGRGREGGPFRINNIFKPYGLEFKIS